MLMFCFCFVFCFVFLCLCLRPSLCICLRDVFHWPDAPTTPSPSTTPPPVAFLPDSTDPLDFKQSNSAVTGQRGTVTPLPFHHFLFLTHTPVSTSPMLSSVLGSAVYYLSFLTCLCSPVFCPASILVFFASVFPVLCNSVLTFCSVRQQVWNTCVYHTYYSFCIT